MSKEHAPGNTLQAKGSTRPASDIEHAAEGAARWRMPEFVFWCAPVVAYFLLPTFRLSIADIAITALFALSLDLVYGYAGLLSLGHAAMFGVGAYTVGILSVHGFGYPLLGLVAAGAASAVVAFVSGLLLLRGNNLSQLMITLGVSLILLAAATQMTSVTGGVNGMSGMIVRPIAGYIGFDLRGRVAYVYSVVVLFVVFFVVRRVVHAPFGQSLRGIRMNRTRMEALGVWVNARLMFAYVLGGFIAGIAGALAAETNQFVSVNSLGFNRSAEVLIILLVGGPGYLYGGLIGAVVFLVAKQLLAQVTPIYWEFWIGAGLVVLVMLRRSRRAAWMGRWTRVARRLGWGLVTRLR